MSGPDTITILRTLSLWMAKRISGTHIEDYSRAKFFDVATEPVACLDDILELLAYRLLDDNHAAVIRGELIDPSQTTHVRRRSHDDRKTGEVAPFREQPRRWVALDIEHIERPDNIAVTDLAACARIAIARLPVAFHRARCIVQATSSHGIKPDIRLRLWFWLSRPTSGDELTRWLGDIDCIDRASFETVQAIYTARPVFLNGTSDPVPQRLAVLDGDDDVAVPSPKSLAPPPPRPTSPPRKPVTAQETGWLTQSTEQYIADTIAIVAAATDGGVHAAVRTAACRLGSVQAQAGFSDAAAVRWLTPAIAHDQRKVEDTILSGLSFGRLHPKEFRLPTPDFPACDPPFPLPTATPVDVHAAVQHAINGFFGIRALQLPPKVVVPGMTGSGKTQKVGELLPHIIAADKAERALRADEDLPYRAIIMVPAHRLGRQIKQRYERLGLSVAILEGRGDPWRPAPSGRRYLCQNLEAVGMALQVHEDVRSAVCGEATGKQRCPFRDGCGYIAQFEAAREADVLIVASTFMFDDLPEWLLHHVAYVIIEEDFVSAADAIGEVSVDAFRKAAIERWPALIRGKHEPDEVFTKLTIEKSEAVAALLDATPDGHMTEAMREAHGITDKDCNYLRHLHWKRKRKARMHPGMSLATRREAVKAAEINTQLPRIATTLHMLAEAPGRLRLFTNTDRDGNARRGIVLHGQREVAEWLRGRPVLMLNASARIDDIRRFFPDAVMRELPVARLEHQRVHQILGAFGKSAMTEKKLAGLEADARAHVAAGKSLLVICHQQDEERFKKITDRVLHHGSYAGDDDHGDVDVIMHIGGPFAPPADIAAMATARYGVPVPIARAVKVPCAALMADGTGRAFERLAYEHPLAQAVHESIYDQAFVQGGLGRGRGINRSAATPLDIYVYGNVPLPVPLASLSRWQPVRERQLLAEGGTHSNAMDLLRFTSAFPTLDAAVKWRQRHPFDEAAIRALLADDGRAFDRVTWQPPGQGHRLRRSIIPTAEVGAFRRRVERHFGRPVVWQVARFTGGEDLDISPRALQPDMSTSSFREVPPWAAQPGETEVPEARGPPDG